MRVSEIARYLDSTPTLNCDSEINDICIDTRKIKPGDLFIALKGVHFDGHDFVEEAVQKGAAVILTQRYFSNVPVPQFVVKDCYAALTKMAKSYRQQFDCPIMAITGSVGKTTTKEMIASLLPTPSFASVGNLNNHLGVPLSVLKLKKEHRYAVFELGASAQGEIAASAGIVQPDLSLITCTAPAHIEGFGSIEGVAKAKGEIYQALGQNDLAVINEDDRYAHFWDSFLQGKRVCRYSLEKQKNANIYASNIHFGDRGFGSFCLEAPTGKMDVHLQVPGIHSIKNALAVASCGIALDLDLVTIAEGLAQFTGVSGRLTFIKGKNKATIIDDTYNANPSSVLAAIEVLNQRKGHKIFVFGDMLELGNNAKAHHEEIGKVLIKEKIDLVLTYGNLAKFTSETFGNNGQHYLSHQELIDALLPILDEHTTILVKGSRGLHMEHIVQALR